MLHGSNVATASPKCWSGASEIVADLRKVDWRGYFEQQRSKHANSDWATIICGAVGANTFRSFRKMPLKPSHVFRAWASDALLKEGRLEQLRGAATASDYDRWLNAFRADLQSHWATRMGTDLRFGASAKLTDLLAKAFCASPDLPPAVAEQLIWMLHVPLDSYSLLSIRNCVAGSGAERLIGNVPTKASMGFVSNFELYNAVQRLMSQLAEQAGVPPIALDVMAWNNAHGLS